MVGTGFRYMAVFATFYGHDARGIGRADGLDWAHDSISAYCLWRHHVHRAFCRPNTCALDACVLVSSMPLCAAVGTEKQAWHHPNYNSKTPMLVGRAGTVGRILGTAVDLYRSASCSCMLLGQQNLINGT